MRLKRVAFVNAFPAVWHRLVWVRSYTPCLFVPISISNTIHAFWCNHHDGDDVDDVAARARSRTQRVQAHKQNDRVLLECQSGILVFFARTPQNMYVRESHANDRCGSSRYERRVSASPLSRIRLSARVVRWLAPRRLIAAWKLTFPFLTLAFSSFEHWEPRLSPFVPHRNRGRPRNCSSDLNNVRYQTSCLRFARTW